MNDEQIERNDELVPEPSLSEAAGNMDETERNEAPVEEAPIEEAPAEEAPAEEVPAEEAPTEEAPAEEAPAEEVPTEEAPAEEAPAGDAPAGEAPAESGMDGITLGVRLCEAVLEAVGRDGFHGGIRPDNISVSRESVSLGSPLLHGVGEFTPQELEYMAPELFWDGVRKPAGDVYSLGMVLYGIYNGGRMPFWPEEGDATPNLRAGALQRRMSREEIPAPSQAGAELSAIILRALAFSEEERWHDTEELRNALSDCEERQEPAADIAAVVAGLSAGGAAPLRVAPARKSRPEPEEDELSSPFVEDADAPDYENEPIPRRRVRRSNRRLAQIIVYSVLIIAIAAAIFLLSRCTRLGPAAVTPTPVVAATLPPDDAVIVIDGNQTAGEATPAPAATPEPTPEPTPAPGVVTYTAYAENVSWSEAKARCLEMGGELAMPQNYAEFVEITKVCEDAGLTYVWLGARRDESGTWVTAAGEPASFFAWGDGEPSGQDTDGTPEDYYLLWNLGDRWSGNDSRENPLDGYWGVYAGKIGFVCKTVTYPEAAPAEPAPEEPAV